MSPEHEFVNALLEGKRGRVMHYVIDSAGRPMSDRVPASENHFPIKRSGIAIGIVCEFEEGGPRLIRSFLDKSSVLMMEKDTLCISPLLEFSWG